MDLAEQHWLETRYPVPSGWYYVCGCGQEFRAGFDDAAHALFTQHLEEVGSDARTC